MDVGLLLRQFGSDTCLILPVLQHVDDSIKQAVHEGQIIENEGLSLDEIALLAIVGLSHIMSVLSWTDIAPDWSVSTESALLGCGVCLSISLIHVVVWFMVARRRRWWLLTHVLAHCRTGIFALAARDSFEA